MVVPDSLVVEQLLLESFIDELEKENTRIVPACVVTRAMRHMDSESKLSLVRTSSERGGVRLAKEVLTPQSKRMVRMTKRF